MKRSDLLFTHTFIKSAVFALLISGLIATSGLSGDQHPTKPYLILYAFDAEGEKIQGQMSVTSIEQQLGRSVVLGEVSGKDIALAESGIGMTNAAMMLQRMIDQYHPRAVIMTGIAGAIDTAVHIGDIVACQDWIEHDYGYIGSEGFSHGGLKAYCPVKDSVVEMPCFHVDSAMLATADRLCDEDFGFQMIGSRSPRLLTGGTGVSGNTFIDSKEKREWLAHEFAALVTDMESAAVAQVCTVNKLPYIIFRSASDLAGGSGSATAGVEMREFFRIAADNSSSVVIRFLREL